MRILRWYILKQHLVPFLLGFGVVTFILEMDVLFDYLDLVVNRGVAPGIVIQLYLLSLGYIVALSVPCGVLVSALMTFGRLSQDNEITAVRASGVNLASVLVAPLSAAAVVGGLLILFNNYVLPETNHAFAGLLLDISRMRPTVKLEEGVFVNDFPGYNLLVQSVNGRTNEMHGITLYQMNATGPPTTILAKSGSLTYTPDGGTAVLTLRDGEIHEVPTDSPADGVRKYRRLEFRTHVIYIPGVSGLLERTVGYSRSDREMSATQLLEERRKIEQQYAQELNVRIQRLQALGIDTKEFRRLAPPPGGFREWVLGGLARLRGNHDPYTELAQKIPQVRTEIDLWTMERDAMLKRVASLSVEIHKKYSLSAACIVFVLVGAPLGMRVRRAGPAVAFVSIAFFLFYYLCLVGGEELAHRLLLPPWLAMWLANIVMGIYGIVATLQVCEILPVRRLARPAAHAAA